VCVCVCVSHSYVCSVNNMTASKFVYSYNLSLSQQLMIAHYSRDFMTTVV